MAVSLEIGSDAILAYKRLSYTPWYALAEFVDNSTQSYFNNRRALDEAYGDEGTTLEIRIVYDRTTGVLRISDNAMGMSLAELTHALKVGKPPIIATGRSQYGLGMKTAACWFGDEWEVRSKRLGEDKEHAVVVDVDAVASGRAELPYQSWPRPEGDHGTVIEVRKLHSRLQGRTLGKIRDFLRSMYRVDLRGGYLKLFWEGSQLEWTDDAQFLRAADGRVYKQPFDFTVNGKRVQGYVGILGEGSSGRPNAGFSILRRGRVVKGHPQAWRPQSIFGQLEGSNNLINQRITGEINLDDFDVSHTKDDILWREDEEDQVETKLLEVSRDYVHIANDFRRRGPDSRGPSDAEVETAVEELKEELESRQLVDLLEIGSVPAPEALKRATQPVLDQVERLEPRFRVRIGDTELRAFLSSDGSPNDPYFATDVGEDHIIVVVNQRHPHWGQIRGAEGVLNYLRHCVYDAVAEWQCRRMAAPLQSDTIKMLKDSLLRLPSEIEQDAAAVAPPTPAAKGEQ